MDPREENLIIRRILEGTATETGDRFFDALVVSLAAALNTYGAWVTEYLPQTNQLRAIALWMGGVMTHDFTYDVAGTACETVLTAKDLIHLPDNVLTLYPDDDHARDLGAVSYLGIPLMDEAGNIMGHLSVLDRQPMPEQARQQAIFRIFAARATAEMLRLKAEHKVRASEDKYRRIVETAGEGFILMNDNHRIVDVNESFCRLLGYSRDEVIGQRPFDFGTDGIWEARNTRGEMFGKRRLKTLLRQNAEAQAGALVDGLFQRLQAFTRGTLPEDDRTLVVAKIKELGT